MLSLLSATIIVEFLVIFCIKVLNMGKTSKLWYKQFGIVAVICDLCSVMIGILLANFLVPKSTILGLAAASVVVQVIHDTLFYLFVIRPMPEGTNAIIDLLKKYASEASYSIIIGDAVMMISTVLVYGALTHQSMEVTAFAGIVGMYAITYIIHTK
jgi:uncharacterized protein YacL